MHVLHWMYESHIETTRNTEMSSEVELPADGLKVVYGLLPWKFCRKIMSSWPGEKCMPCRICSFADFLEGVIRCKIVATDFVAEEIAEVSRKICIGLGTWMVDNQGLALFRETCHIFKMFFHVFFHWNKILFLIIFSEPGGFLWVFFMF